MKALILENKRTLQIREYDTPKTADDHVIIDVEIAGIGGSEYLGYNNPGIRPLPSIMGHGFAGVTPEGKRVAVYPLTGCNTCQYCLNNQTQLCISWSLIGVQSNGGFAEKVSVPRDSVVDLPERLSWEQAVFVEPFANSVNAWHLSQAIKSHSVAIIGAGGLGLGLVACAKQSSCLSISVADLSENRRMATLEMGATEANPTLNGEYDIVFDTVGSTETRVQAIEVTKKGGKVVFLGFETPLQELNISEIIRHQKRLIGSFVYSKSQFEAAIELAQMCNSSWVTSIGFSEVEEYLIRFLENDFSTIKVALRPNQ